MPTSEVPVAAPHDLPAAPAAPAGPPANNQRRRLALITNSELKTFRGCAREHYLAYLLGYRPRAESEALRFGSLFHCALEAWWRAVGAGAADPLEAAIEAMRPHALDEYDLVRAGVLIQGYDARWRDAEVEVLAVEVEFRAPLINPATGAPSKTYELGGKLDVIVRSRGDGLVYIVEHKTTGEDVGGGSQYWQRLQLDGQVSTYFAGARALGYEPAGCLYDVIAKPRIAPLKATPVDKQKFTKDGRLYAAQRADDETPDEYRVRLLETITAEPERYYQRAPVVRLEDEEREHAFDTWQTARAMREGQIAGRHPRNPDHCTRWGRLCSYFAVCTATASLEDPTLYQHLDNVHPELAAVSGATGDEVTAAE